MAIRVALDDLAEGGQYALLKEVEELHSGDRRFIKGAVPLTLADDGKGGTALVYPGDYDEQMKNALLVRVVTEWNLPHQLPSKDPAVLDRLSVKQLDKLYEATEAYVEFLNASQQSPATPGSDPTSGSSS